MDWSKGERPKLTVITICKDIAGDIVDTCESVMSQTFQDFEWIVVDGASTDGTLEVLERYRRRIDTLISEPDGGAYNAMNKGVALASGEYLLFLNGGDYLVENTVLERVSAMKHDADILYGNGVYLHDDGFFERYATPPAEAITKPFFAYEIINHQLMFIRKALFERFGLYDEQYRILADWERWVVFLEKGCTFGKLDVTVSVFRLNGMSNQKRNKERHSEELNKIRAAYFTAEELREGRRIQKRLKRYNRTYALGAFGPFSIFSIEREPNGREITKYKFMNITIVKIDGRKNIYLRGIGKVR